MKVIEDIKLKRKELNLTIADIAEKLHLQENYIKFIEAEEFNKFPDKIYLYGYIVRYMKLLNMNILDYKEELERLRTNINEVKENEVKKVSFNKKIISLISFIILILIIISILFLIEKKEIPKEEKKNIIENNIIEEAPVEKNVEISKNEIKIVCIKKTNIKYQSDTNAIETKVFNAGDSMVINFYNSVKVNLENVWNAGIIANDTYAQLGSYKNKKNVNLEFYADSETKKIKWREIENF